MRSAKKPATLTQSCVDHHEANSVKSMLAGSATRLRWGNRKSRPALAMPGLPPKADFVVVMADVRSGPGTDSYAAARVSIAPYAKETAVSRENVPADGSSPA